MSLRFEDFIDLSLLPSTISDKVKNIELYSSWEFGIGGSVWPVAHTLCSYLQQYFKASFWENKRIIELGAGSGIVGIIISVLDVSNTCRVELTDIGNHVNLIAENIKLFPMEKNLSCREYLWGSCALSNEDIPYDIIIGSDITYDTDFFDDLILSLKYLSGPKTLIILALQKRDPYMKLLLFVTNADRNDCILLFSKLENAGFEYRRVNLKQDVFGIFQLSKSQ